MSKSHHVVYMCALKEDDFEWFMTEHYPEGASYNFLKTSQDYEVQEIVFEPIADLHPLEPLYTKVADLTAAYAFDCDYLSNTDVYHYIPVKEVQGFISGFEEPDYEKSVEEIMTEFNPEERKALYPRIKAFQNLCRHAHEKGFIIVVYEEY